MEEFKYLVRVNSMTYNHAPYIEDAMNGFCMQETTFPFVCTIIDDASTDGEPEVIENYLKEHFDLSNESVVRKEETDDYVLTFTQHKTNKNCFFAVLLLKYNHYGIGKPKEQYIEDWSEVKYIAWCEGDDYWTDPMKLEKQVGFLESNPDFVVCAHRFWIKEERKEIGGDLEEYPDHKRLVFENEYGVEGFVFDKDNYWKCWYTQPLTIVQRNGNYIHKIPAFKYKYYRDVIFFYYTLRQGKGMLLKDRMGVYRKTNGGIFASKSIVDNALITNDNLRTIFLVENDEAVLPILHNNVIFLMKDSLKSMNIKNTFEIVKDHLGVLPVKKKAYFVRMLVSEPFKTIKRKIDSFFIR